MLVTKLHKACPMWNPYVRAPLLLITCDFVNHRNTYPLKIGHGQLKRKANDD